MHNGIVTHIASKACQTAGPRLGWVRKPGNITAWEYARNGSTAEHKNTRMYLAKEARTNNPNGILRLNKFTK